MGLFDKPQIQQQPMMQQPNTEYAANPKDIDPDLAKHVLDSEKLEFAFKCMFSGWMVKQEEETIDILGVKKTKFTNRIVIDWYSRVVNEYGANYFYNTFRSLLIPATFTSHLKPIDIYNHWHGGLMTFRAELIEMYHLPSYVCIDKIIPIGDPRYINDECCFISSDITLLRQHQNIEDHSKVVKILNPYQLNINRQEGIITKLANLAVLTMKAKEGFNMKEISENYYNANVMRNGYMPPPTEHQGFFSKMSNAMYGR